MLRTRPPWRPHPAGGGRRSAYPLVTCRVNLRPWRAGLVARGMSRSAECGQGDKYRIIWADLRPRNITVHSSGEPVRHTLGGVDRGRPASAELVLKEVRSARPARPARRSTDA